MLRNKSAMCGLARAGLIAGLLVGCGGSTPPAEPSSAEGKHQCGAAHGCSGKSGEAKHQCSAEHGCNADTKTGGSDAGVTPHVPE